MAGPSVVVRVLGDVSAFTKSLTAAGEHGAGAFSKLHSGFSSMLGAINQTGVLGPFGAELETVNEAIGKLGEHGKTIGGVMAGVGGAVTGAGALLAEFGSKEKAAHQQLQAAVAATGHSYETYGKQIEEAVHHQENFGHSSEQTQDALRVLTTATNDPAKALALLNEASDLAAAKHEDLATAATQLGKVYNGNTKLLKEFGIQVTATAALQKAAVSASKQSTAADSGLAHAKRTLADIELVDGQRHKLTLGQQIQLRNAQEAVTVATGRARDAHQRLTAAQDAVRKATAGHGGAVDLLAGKLKGQATAAANTFGGKLDALKTKVEDQVAVFGQKYGPALQIVGVGFMAMASIMEIGSAAMAAAEALPLLPILAIVAAIGILAFAGYEIYKHWNTIWTGMKKIIEDVWNWIQQNWPYLLGVLLGPIALAAALIYKHWDRIKKDAKAVIDYVVHIWNDLVTFFVGIPARLYAVANGLWTFISDEAQTVSGWVVGVWNGLISWVAGVPGAIARVMNGLWTFISDQAKTVYSWVVGTWNTLLNWVGGMPAAIARVASGMWHGITDAFRAAINGLIDIWDRLHFKIGGWHVGPVTIPTVDVGMPAIPHLAQGGLMTASGLVFAHAGEVITPAPAAARRGPVVNVEKAVFSTHIDVEAFLKQVAWVAASRGL